MFDPVTTANLSSAPGLDGIDPERLPRRLTDAYVQVSVASAFLDGVQEHVDSGLLDEIESVARAQETLALVIPDAELRRAAAHVAARAYQVLASASGLEEHSEFHASSIPAAISSMLLFIVADATADAEEVARYLPEGSDTVVGVLQTILSCVGRADFSRVASLELPEFQPPISIYPHEVAAYVGYYDCARELIQLCSGLQQAPISVEERGFEKIRDRLAGSFPVRANNNEFSVDDTIAGPWHLATLLNLASRVLSDSAVAGVVPPSGVAEGPWREFVERVARRRPNLWRNHRHAISQGFLEPGKSAVVTFPTGAGKSTVIELKIAATVLRRRNAIILVPTLSLLDQQAASLRSIFPELQVIAERDEVNVVDVDQVVATTTIFVMTPESCLASYSADPERFGDIGLISFDEAHLITSAADIPERRSLDAMLCLLLLTTEFQAADVLLVSAMIENSAALSDWLRDDLGRDPIDLSDPWKPTRQARGALVYKAADLDRLGSLIRTTESATDGPPAALRRQVAATPHGLFGLRTTWQSTDSTDYRLLPLLPGPATLAVTGKQSQGGWRLASNSNGVAAQLAIVSAKTGQKVLVFSQQVRWSVSTANEINDGSERRTALTPVEERLLRQATEAMGSASTLYGNFDGNSVIGDALPHHGLLLREERRLHESLYRRSNGISVLVATSTLAQGMNFPSEIIVIAGDRRFDADTNRMERLEAQELLNAAGRAGRAGMRANGIVIVVPSFPVGYDGEQQIGPGWFDLRQAFSRADQCVEVIDPITVLLQHPEPERVGDQLDYLVRRLAGADQRFGPHEIVLRSFGAFRARRAGNIESLERRLAETSLVLESDRPDWVKSVVASTGIAPDDIEFIGAALTSNAPAGTSLLEWVGWYRDLLGLRPAIVETTLRAGSRAAFRGSPKELGGELERLTADELVVAINAVLSPWLAGSSIADLQAMAERLHMCRPSSKCEFARKVVLRVMPDLAYLFGLPRLIVIAMGLEGEFAEFPVAKLNLAVEFGVDTVAKVDYLLQSPERTRREAHAIESGEGRSQPF